MDKQSGDAFEFGCTLQAFPPPATKCSAGGEKSSFVEIVSSRHSRPRAVTMAPPAAAQRQHTKSSKMRPDPEWLDHALRHRVDSLTSLLHSQAEAKALLLQAEGAM